MAEHIRAAKTKEMPELLAMAQEGLASVHPDLPFDPAVASEMIAQAIDDNSMIALVAEDAKGLCGLLIAQAEYSWFGPGSVASDWISYVSPRAKGWLWYRLFDEYTRWAKSMDVTVINTVNLSGKSDDRLVHAIGRLGYEKAGSMVRQVGKPYKGNL